MYLFSGALSNLDPPYLQAARETPKMPKHAKLPEFAVKLLQQCLELDASKRPTASMIADFCKRELDKQFRRKPETGLAKDIAPFLA